MKKIILIFLLGFIIGQCDPAGKIAWLIIETQLPHIKQDSINKPSFFQELPQSEWVMESEHAFAIENPYAIDASTHLLVVPKERYLSVLETPDYVLKDMLELIKKSSKEYGMAKSGFRITINTNPHGGQSVYHTHMHIKGGSQQTSPLLPAAWNYLMHEHLSNWIIKTNSN